MKWKLFVAAIFALALCATPALARPVVEARPGAEKQPFFVVWLSGDGGWGLMEREVSARLSAAGAPTVGISSLRYYARPHGPREAAREVAKLVDAYGARWGKQRFVFVGFSFGADAGPFVVADLPAATRQRLAMAAFLSPGERANFWAGPWSWLNIGLGPKVAPRLDSLAPTRVLCVGDAGIFKDICPAHAPPGMVSKRLQGGHLLIDQYDAITQLILEQARAAR